MCVRLSLIIVIWCSVIQVSFAEEFTQASAAIQISSTVSDGKYSIPEIITIAKKNNIQIVILADYDLARWEYGLWPLRNVIKKTKEENSVFKYGIRRYLHEIEDMQKINPDLILIPGLESAPFYYWQGSPFNNSLTLKDWHKHILVMGLEKLEDYENLPIIGNKQALRLPFKFKNIFALLWPGLILAIGLFCVRKRRFNYQDSSGRCLGPFCKRWQLCGFFLMSIGLLFLANSYPFCDFKFDQYKGNLGIMPYQNFIDYVKQHGGLTFWAHPEAEYISKIDGVSIETREHTYNLIQAHGYTGFAVFYEGYNKVGIPNGLWDEVLKQYCQGRRKAPIWAIGALSFDSAGDLDEYMQDLRTVFLISHFSKQEVLKALREGRMYVIRGKDSSRFILDKFIIKDIVTNAQAGIGRQIILKGKPIIDISGHFLNGQKQAFRIKLIRNGSVIKTFEVDSPFEISYQDDYQGKDGRFYYRLEIQSSGILLVTNPIFVKQDGSFSASAAIHTMAGLF